MTRDFSLLPTLFALPGFILHSLDFASNLLGQPVPLIMIADRYPALAETGYQ